MVKIAVSGGAGRMGRMIMRLILEGADTELYAAVERAGHPEIGRDAGHLAGVGESGVLLTDSLPDGGDAVIDFSSPENSSSILDRCVETGQALVVGTTGLDDAFHARVKIASGTIACLVGPNMSVGMNVLFNTVGRVARTLGPDYDIEIVEVHHRMKKDSPSGTALRLAECIQEDIGKRDLVHGREGMVGERKTDELGIHAVRAGDVVGEHTVIYGGPGEVIEIRHRAQSRETFAAGAVRASVFVAGNPAGVYTMEDVLGIKE